VCGTICNGFGGVSVQQVSLWCVGVCGGGVCVGAWDSLVRVCRN